MAELWTLAKESQLLADIRRTLQGVLEHPCGSQHVYTHNLPGSKPNFSTFGLLIR